MNKKVTSLVLASTLLVSIQSTNTPAMAQVTTVNCASVGNLTDVTSKHWAYGAVKFVTQDFCIMPPRTSTKFEGKEIATRYDVANAFYNSAKKLESVSGKNLKVVEGSQQVKMGDLKDANKDVVNSIVNEYGIMQSMPGNKFMGGDKMSRYELAFELNNYLKLLETKVGKNTLEPIDRSDSLKDVKEDHWATPSIKDVVNKYQIMSGYPDNTFKGNQTLTRYEMAAVLRKFFDYVDKYLIPTVAPTPEPTPVPTVEPTVVPTPEPTPVPSVTPERPPLPTVDLRLGGNYHISGNGSTVAPTTGALYGPSAAVNFWFGDSKFWGIGLNGDYSIYDSTFKPAGLGRITYGGDINFRLLGKYADDFQLNLGVGYQLWQLTGNSYGYLNHGPKAKASIEIPIGWVFSLFAEDTFAYYLGQTEKVGFINNNDYSNDLYAGITIPAYTCFSIQLGYKDVRYKLKNSADWKGDIGGLANLRFRF